MLILRHYQDRIKQKCYSLWRKGVNFILIVMPTGMGKTATFCSIAYDIAIVGIILDLIKNVTEQLPTAIVVHREELLSQISLTLARDGIVHNILAPPTTITMIMKEQRLEYGKTFYNQNSTVAIVSVDTFNSRYKKNPEYKKFAERIRFWICDEAAHVLKDNKWGKCLSKFVNARGLGVTATPQRLDKKGLGTEELGGHGFFEAKVEGPSTYWGITEGYLSDFDVAIAESDMMGHLTDEMSGGDYARSNLKMAASKSRITGDVVENYLKYAAGKQAILFAPDVETAQDMVRKFIKAGVTAELITGESLKTDRYYGILRFRNKETKVLINIDLFDEGFDVPGIECVIMARPSKSLSKVLQMYGRGLRPVYAKGYDLSTKEGRLTAQARGPKPKCILIDHVGNIKQHGPPNASRRWTLSGGTFKPVSKSKDCWACFKPFLKVLKNCPHCGVDAIDPNSLPKGGGRIPPEKVDGDLRLIDSQTLKELYEKARKKDPGEVGQRVANAAGPAAGARAAAQQLEKNEYHPILAERIATWAGELTENGYDEDMINKEFWSQFDMTILDALGSSRKEMERIVKELI